MSDEIKSTELLDIFALIAVDPNDGIEGVVVSQYNGVAIPMVAPEAQTDMLIEAGQNMASSTGLTIRLVKFARAEDVQKFLPKKPEELSLDGNIENFTQNPPDKDMQYPRTQY